MYASTEHPFHIQSIALFVSLVPIVALLTLLFVASFVQHQRRTRKPTQKDVKRQGGTAT